MLTRRRAYHNLRAASLTFQSSHSFTSSTSSLSSDMSEDPFAFLSNSSLQFSKPRSVMVASFRSCPNPQCTLDIKHRYEDEIPFLRPPTGIPQLLIHRFDPTSHHPFPNSNVWAVHTESRHLVAEGATVFIEDYGLVVLHPWAIRRKKGWQGFNCFSKDGLLELRLLVQMSPTTSGWGKWAKITPLTAFF